MTLPASIGTQSRLSMAAPGTAIASYTEAHEFAGESLAKSLTILQTAGIRGTRASSVSISPTAGARFEQRSRPSATSSSAERPRP